MFPNKAALCLTSPSEALLKRSNVEFVDVATYCDKLCLAISRPRNALKPSSSVTRTVSEADKLPFRQASNLYHATLRVYKMQVDSLLEKSKALLARSNFDLVGLTATKRKSSASITGVSAKKRCLLKGAKDINFSHYTELLEESENLQHWSECQITLNKQTTNDGAKPKTANSRLIQIREITIREINADISQSSLDEDSGFGNATAEELNEFVQLFAENHAKPSEKEAQTTKRKGSVDSCVPGKIAKNEDDSAIEMPRHGNANMKSPWQTANDVDIHAASSSDEDINIDINTIIMNLDKETASDGKAASIDSSVEFATKPELLPTLALIPLQSANAQKKRKKRRKLLVDKFTKLTGAEMRAQLSCSKTVAVESYKASTDKFVPARQLLTTFGRKSNLILHKIFKRKRRFSRESARTEYITLLRDILNRSVDDQLSNEIYSGWNDGAVQSWARKHKDRHPLGKAQKWRFEEDFANNNTSQVCHDDLGAHSEAESLEWNAYGVMMKLLDMWRYQANGTMSDEIAVKHLFPVTTISRKEAASGFSSLLLLSSRRFIELIKTPDSIKLQKVRLGTASEKLIRQTQLSSLT